MRRLRTRSLFVLGTTLLAACGGASVPPSPGNTAPVSQVFGQTDAGYSMAARYGDLVWTAGHLPEAASPGDSVGRQTEAVMDGLRATLDAAGAGFDTVVMTNVYLTDFDTWPEFNEVYTRYFEGRVPPRVTVQVSGLAFGNIEISMVAHTR